MKTHREGHRTLEEVTMKAKMLVILLLVFASVTTARQVTVKGKTNEGSFGPPPAALSLNVQLIVPAGGNVLDPGQRATLKVSVTNTGGRDAESVNVSLAASPALVGITYKSVIEIGNVTPGALKEATIEILAEDNVKSQTASLTLQASTSAGIKSESKAVSLVVREKPRVPLLVATAEFSEPSGNKMLDAGEKGTVRVTITNSGTAASRNTIARLSSSWATTGISFTPAVSVGEIAPGNTATALLTVAAAENVPNQTIELSLTASCDNGTATEPLMIAINTKEMVVVDLTPPEIELKEPIWLITRGLKIIERPSEFRTEAPSIAVRGIATDSGGISVVLVGGRESKLKETVRGAEFSTDAPLNVGPNDIEIKAVDKRGNQNALRISVVREEPLIKGNYYALVIAVQDYQDASVNDLEYPVRDAESFFSTITSTYRFDPQNVVFLRNATRVQIIESFDQLSRKLTEDDNLLIFYAGHGFWDEKLRQGYWLPADASRSTRAGWISNGTIRDYVGGVNTKHTLLISDACFSGGIFKTREAFANAPPAIRELYKLPSRKAMTSGTMKEQVPDKSVFIEYLVKRLKENKDPMLTAETLFASFRQAVINNSPIKQIPQFGEIRETGDEGGDFIFVRR